MNTKNEYISSIIHKYGDMSNVKRDVLTLNDIISRQGTSVLIDCISEHAGNVSNKFKLDERDRNTLIESLIYELKSSLLERL